MNMFQAVRLANALVGCHKGPLNSMPEGPEFAKKSVWLYLEGIEHVNVRKWEKSRTWKLPPVQHRQGSCGCPPGWTWWGCWRRGWGWTGKTPTASTPLTFKIDVLSVEISKHCQRHNGPRILRPKLELSQKAETNANSNVDFFPRYYFLVYLISTLKTIVIKHHRIHVHC